MIQAVGNLVHLLNMCVTTSTSAIYIHIKLAIFVLSKEIQVKI